MSFATVVRTFVFACFKHLVCGVPAPAVESTCGSAYEGRECEKASPLSEIEGLLQDDVVGGVGLVQRRSTQLTSAFSDDWEDFKSVYGRTYESDEEEQTRYSIFNEKKATATQRMVGNPKAVHGVTKFSDWSSVEFKGKLLTFRASTEEQKEARPTHVPTAPLRFPEMAKYFDGSVGSSSLPDSWDWREHGALTPVKNQWYCGSCWAFASVGNVESTWYLSGNELPILSEQQVVSCDTVDYGCDGGNMQTAFEYVMSAPVDGLVSASVYPYYTSTWYGDSGVCNTALASPENRNASITSWAQVSMDASGEALMRLAVLSSPYTIALDAIPMETYVSGIDCPADCDPDDLDHAVMIVGYGLEDSVNYWLIRNSWGEDWGEEGYYRLCAGQDECGVAMDAVVALNS